MHSGDSACVHPVDLARRGHARAGAHARPRALARALGVQGLMNVQFAYQSYELYVLEVNPRASRTVPFVSKATGVQLAKLATRVILGATLAELGLPQRRVPRHVSVKEAVMPFNRFPGADYRLGPEMKATGEVMARRRHVPAGLRQGRRRRPARRCPPRAPSSSRSATPTSRRPPSWRSACTASGSPSSPPAARRAPCRASACRRSRSTRSPRATPHIVDLIEEGRVDFVVNTPFGRGARSDGYEIRTRGPREGRPLHHDPGRRLGGRLGHRGGAAAAGDGALPAGPARRTRKTNERRRR